jgi:hypothetical protein
MTHDYNEARATLLAEGGLAALKQEHSIEVPQRHGCSFLFWLPRRWGSGVLAPEARQEGNYEGHHQTDVYRSQWK